MTEQAYKRHVDYRFTVCGEEFAIVPGTWRGKECCDIEETRKNGKEDCHMSGFLVKENGEWKWEEGRDCFETYSGRSMITERILDYLNQHGLPESE